MSKNSNPFIRNDLNLRVVQTQAPAYAVYGEDVNDRSVHIGDAESQEAAEAVVQRLGSQPGVYSRCREISTLHLTGKSDDYLMEQTNLDTSDSYMFAVFRVPYSPAIGVSLISTPWTDANLQRVESVTVEYIRQVHKVRGLPDDLANILYLAAEADVRILIFDVDAPLLPGLPVYAHE